MESRAGITTIVHRLRRHVENRLDYLIDNGYVETEQVHRSYEYPAAVTNQRAWSHFGVFFDYLIRREAYALRGHEAFDKRAEKMKSALEEYESGLYYGEDGLVNGGNVGLVRKFLASYEIYKDTEYHETYYILKDIFNTCMLHMVSYGRTTIPYNPALINQSMVKTVLNYVSTWHLRAAMINPSVGGENFCGDADFIFNDYIMDMKVSKYEAVDTIGLYQMIFYALGLHLKKGQGRRIFKVYNPLLGTIYTLKIPNLNFHELRCLLDEESCWD